jgi:GNAT superfamily N-acetyltransferase
MSDFSEADRMVDMQIHPARQENRADALRVWRAANVARAVVPSSQRVDRVRAKLAEEDAVLLIGCVDEKVRAMVLAEPWREADGTGPVVGDRGHVSRVFVDPDYWGRGFGTSMLAVLGEAAVQRGWVRTSLWTRETNHRARRLYLRACYQPTGRSSELPNGERILEFQQTRGSSAGATGAAF